MVKREKGYHRSLIKARYFFSSRKPSNITFGGTESHFLLNYSGEAVTAIEATMAVRTILDRFREGTQDVHGKNSKVRKKVNADDSRKVYKLIEGCKKQKIGNRD